MGLVSGVALRNYEPGLYYCEQTLLNIECGETSGKRGMGVVGSGESGRGGELRDKGKGLGGTER